MQFEEQEEDAKPEEDGRMEVDEETDPRKKLEMRTRDIIKDMRKVGRYQVHRQGKQEHA